MEGREMNQMIIWLKNKKDINNICLILQNEVH